MLSLGLVRRVGGVEVAAQLGDAGWDVADAGDGGCGGELEGIAVGLWAGGHDDGDGGGSGDGGVRGGTEIGGWRV
ncbi:hypothetical protein V494_02928 [Pseudogymnoascus sp. VKM F-4513 (FW-928)]|nr:hypothetical protein V494_02928 [Pseudogymnoascus sp. VKM F-4513 (FW-928)]